MTSVMIVHDIDLLRGALAAMLSHQPDLDVVAQLATSDDVVSAARARQPNVAVLYLESCDVASLALPRRLRMAVPGCDVLLITGQHRADALLAAVEAGIRGFLGTDAEPESLIDAVRRIAAGERVIDPLLLGTALRNDKNPLTDRQRDVLRLAAEGLNASDIGRRLFLAPGTVRNYLSAAIRRVGGRSVLEAACRARFRGWL